MASLRWVVRVVVSASLTMAAAPAVASEATAAPAAANPQIQWVSECAGKRKTVSALASVPTLLDVCGNFLPDLFATYTGGPGAGRIQLTRFILAPASMPLEIEAVVTSPASAGRVSQAFGYDATASNAPGNFSQRFTASGSDLDVAITTSGPAASLDVIAALFEAGTSGVRLKPQHIRLGYAPVPASAAMSLDTGPGSAVVGLTAASPSAVGLTIQDHSTAAARELSARIDRLPGSVTLDLASVGAANRVGYAASAPVDHVDLAVHDAAAVGVTGRATDLRVRLEGVPAAVSVDFASDGNTFVTTASAVLGSLEARLFSGTPAATLPAGQDGVILRDTAAGYEALVRVDDLRSLNIHQRPAIDVQVDSTAGRPFVVELAQRAADPDAPDQTLAALIENLAPTTRLQFAEDSAGARTLTYVAAAPVNRVEVHANNMPSVGRAVRADLVLTGLPTSATLDFGREGSDQIVLDAGSATIGTLFAQLTSGPDTTLAGDGLKLVDTPDQYTVLARITGLRSVAVRQRPHIEVQTSTSVSVPFTVDLRQSQAGGPDQTTLVQIADLAAALSFSFTEASGTGHRVVNHSASAAVSRISLSADNLPLEGRARSADLVLTGLPTSLSLDLGSEGGGVELTTGGASIGSVEALLTSGPIATVPPGQDGLVLRDTAAQYTLAARITGLRRVRVDQTPLSLFLDATGSRPFRVDVQEQSVSGQVLFTNVAVNNLRPATSITLEDAGGTSELRYAASGSATSLTMSTNAGERARLDVSVAPVPAALSVCAAAASNACGHTSVPANRLSLRVLASSAAVVNLADCLSLTCADQRLRLENLQVSKLELNLHAGDSGLSGQAWLDTDGTNLVGQLFMDTGSDRLTGIFPSGFRANDRHAVWSLFSTPTRSGSITCPSGTALTLEVGPGVVVPVAPLYLC